MKGKLILKAKLRKFWYYQSRRLDWGHMPQEGEIQDFITWAWVKRLVHQQHKIYWDLTSLISGPSVICFFGSTSILSSQTLLLWPLGLCIGRFVCLQHSVQTPPLSFVLSLDPTALERLPIPQAGLAAPLFSAPALWLSYRDPFHAVLQLPVHMFDFPYVLRQGRALIWFGSESPGPRI